MARIVVGVKAVPLGPPVARVAPDGAWRDASEWRLDPINALNVEWAVRLLETGWATDVDAVAVGAAGPADVALRDALARGATSALRVDPGDVEHPDVPSTAALLAAATRAIGGRVLALGYESYDGSSGVLPAAAATALDWGLITRARRAVVDDDAIEATRSTATGLEGARRPLPAVISFVEGEIVARHPSLRAVMGARATTIPSIAASELGATRLTSWTTGLSKVEPAPPRRRSARVLDARDGLAELIALVASDAGSPARR